MPRLRRRRIGPEAAWQTCAAAPLPVPSRTTQFDGHLQCESEHRSRGAARAEHRAAQAIFSRSGTAARCSADMRTTAKLRGGSACHARITVSTALCVTPTKSSHTQPSPSRPSSARVPADPRTLLSRLCPLLHPLQFPASLRAAHSSVTGLGALAEVHANSVAPLAPVAPIKGVPACGLMQYHESGLSDACWRIFGGGSLCMVFRAEKAIVLDAASSGKRRFGIDQKGTRSTERESW